MPFEKNKTSANSLYLTYDGLTDQLGQSQILPYLMGLSDLGHKITVISFEKGKGKTLPKSLSSGNENRIEIIPLRYHKSPPVLSTLLDIYLLKREVNKILKSKKIDVIHCRSYITSIVGLWAKRNHAISFVFDMRGFWADERVEGKIWNLSSPVFKQVYRYFKHKELQFISESSAIISLTHNAKNEMLSWEKAKLDPEKVQVIPTCANFELFDFKSVDINDTDLLRTELGINKDDFVLLYLGSLGTWYMLDEMLDFFEELKRKKSKQNVSAKFLFVTKDQTFLRNHLSDRNMANQDIIVTQSTRENVPKYISLCDAGVFFILPTFSKKASAATKMGEIMAMGKPVLTNAGWGDVDVILKDSSDGILVSSLDAKGYQQAFEDYEKKFFDSAAIRQNADKYFSLASGVEAYHETYLKLLDSKATN